MRLTRGLLAFSVYLFAQYVQAHPIARWHSRNPTPIALGLNGIAYGAGRFVAVGDFGSIIVSSNGTDWQVQSSFTASTLSRVIYADHRFFAVGAQGAIFWSADGLSWNNVSLPMPAYTITSLTYGVPTNSTTTRFTGFASIIRGSSFVDDTISLTSDDGVNWRTNSLRTLRLGRVITHSAFGNGRFVAAQDGGPTALYSIDGVNWRVSFATLSAAVDFGQGRFVMAIMMNQISPYVSAYRSEDGNAWQATSFGALSGQVPSGLRFGDGRFVAVGNRGHTAVTTDGTNWSVNVLETDSRLNTVAFGNGLFVAVGSSGAIYSSADGASWVQRSTGTGRNLSSAAAGDGKCLAVGSLGTIVWSSNGWNWTTVPSPTTNTYTDACYVNGKWMIAGTGGTIVAGDEVDDLSIRQSGTTKTLWSIAASAAGTSVAVGDGGTVVGSTNGNDWTIRDSTVTNRLVGIAHGNETFVAVGDSGTILTSSDGNNWIQRESGVTKGVTDVAFGNGMFIAGCSVGLGPSVLLSYDGRDWIPVDNLSIGVAKVAFGNGMFFCWAPTNGAAFFTASTDGRVWERRMVTSNYPLATDFAYFDGFFFSVGLAGQIMQSDPVVRIAFDPNSKGIALLGPSRGSFQIEFSDGLDGANDWLSLTNLASVPYLFSDPDAISRPFRFYRARFIE